MKRTPAAPAAYWITGTLVAFLGVLVARLGAPQFSDPTRTWLTAAGQIVGAVGLFVIALGVRRRLACATEAATNADTDARAKEPL